MLSCVLHQYPDTDKFKRIKEKKLHLFAIAFQLPSLLSIVLGIDNNHLFAFNQYSESIPHNAEIFPQSSK